MITPTSFNEPRYPPSGSKDRRLVLRTAAGLATKDLETFLETAKRCPDHRFVLVLGHAQRSEHLTEAMIDERNRRESPCEVLVDLPHEKTAELIGEAGIYLHTHGTEAPFGMPISIAEAMASGCYVVARDLPGAAAYLAGHGSMYDGATVEDRAEAAAGQILATTTWSDAEWRRRWTATVDSAWARFASASVVGGMLRAWKAAQPTLPIGAD